MTDVHVDANLSLCNNFKTSILDEKTLHEMPYLAKWLYL